MVYLDFKLEIHLIVVNVQNMSAEERQLFKA